MKKPRSLRQVLGSGMLLVAAALLPAHTGRAEATPIAFELQAVKSTYLVGEPVVLTLRQHGTATLRLLYGGYHELWRTDANFRIVVDRGQGFTRYRAKRLYSLSGWGEEEAEVKDGERAEFVLSYDDNIHDCIFPSPGTVRVAVEYEDEQLGLIRSNVVTLGIKAPDGGEKEVHDVLGALPDRGTTYLMDLNGPGGTAIPGWEAALMAEHPRSVYLQGPRVRTLEARVASVTDAIDPSDPTSPPASDHETRERLLRERRVAFLPEAEDLAADLEGGQFEPDALLLLAGLVSEAGDDDRADSIFARIARDFPDRLAGRIAKEEIGDDEPPELHVSPSPSSLWPPSHGLEPVTVTVTVTDNVDPDPCVKLVSIVCEDSGVQQPAQKGQGQAASQGCDHDDIAEATYGTDDREFRLRAQRVGFGAGRVYTITYEASDAAGNTTRSTATVTVGHDQGGGQKNK